MNLLLSIFILFLSHELCCSEPQRMQRSDSTDTVDETYYRTIKISSNEHHTLRIGEREYLKLKLTNAQAKYLESANQVHDLKKRNNELENNLAAQIIQLRQRITTDQNEEFEDLSCSIVGPKFRVWPCFKSQPLPKHISIIVAREDIDNPFGCGSDLQAIYYHDTITNKRLDKLQPRSIWTQLLYCACCVQKKLPHDIEIRPQANHPNQKIYYDKIDNRGLEVEYDCTWTGYYSYLSNYGNR